MQVDLHAKVRTRDGASAGGVQKAIVDPSANQVTDFVVSTGGLFGYDVMVPRQRLESSSREGDELCLDLTRDELKNLPRYEPDDYTVPTVGWLTPVGYGAYPASAFVWPISYVPTDFSPNLVPPEDDESRSEEWPAIEKGAAVRDRGDEKIGVVEDVRLDPTTGQLQALVVRAGGTLQRFLGGGETHEVRRSEIERVGDGNVYLRVDVNDVKG